MSKTSPTNNPKKNINFSILYKSIDDFLNYLKLEKFYSNHTVKNYYYSLSKFLNIFVDNYPEISSWDNITEDMIRHSIRFFKGNNAKDIQNRSRAHLVSILKSYYKFLIRNNIVKENIMEFIKLPKFSKKLPQYLTYDQIMKLLTLPSDPTLKEIRLNTVIEVLFSTGIRISELCNIQLSDIDFNNFQFRVIGKGNKERIVPFGRFANDALIRWLKVRDCLKPTVNYLFINRFGSKLSSRAIELELSKLGESLNLPIGVTPHMLRHSFATEMIAGGADLRIVQELLGHTSLGVTQVYLHLDELRLRKAYVQAHPLENELKDIE